MNNKRLRFVLAASLLITSQAMANDTDNDGATDDVDNCVALANPDQRDTDADGIGNRCDPDIAAPNDCIVNFPDLDVVRGAFFATPSSNRWNADADLNGDDAINFLDLNIVRTFFFSAPGPGAPFNACDVPTYTDDIQPLLEEKCAPCHTQFGFGGHNIATVWTDAFLPALYYPECAGLNVGQCSLTLIQIGRMPQGYGCTGDPATDGPNPFCLTQQQQDLVEAWIDGGLPE